MAVNFSSSGVYDANIGSTTINEIYLGERLVYKALPPEPPNYFWSEAVEDCVFTLAIPAGVTTGNVTSVSYSLDNGTTWTTTNNVANTAVTITTPTVTAGNKVLWKGTAIKYGTGTTAANNTIFNGTGEHVVGGDIGYLFYGDDYTGIFTSNTQSYGFSFFFNNDTTLSSVEDLVLSPLKIGTRWYYATFYGCSGITKLPSMLATSTGGDNWFQCMYQNCTSLTSADISSYPGAASISNSMFDGCTSLTSVTVSSSCTSVGEYAFRNTKLSSLSFLPSGVTNIKMYAFYQTLITSVSNLPSSITTIGNYAFSGADATKTCQITTLNLSSFSITSLGNYAFAYCPITSITLPSTLESIGGSCFRNTLITSIQFPSTLKSIGGSAFQSCTGLRGTTADFSGCTQLTTISMQNLEAAHINLPSSITTINGDGFRGTRMDVIDLSSCTGLTAIPIRCFYGNESYTTTIKLPSSITTVSTGNFATISGGTVVCYATTPPTCAGTLTGTSRWTLYVPYSANHSVLTAYQNDTYWGAVTNIVELNPDGTIPV